MNITARQRIFRPPHYISAPEIAFSISLKDRFVRSTLRWIYVRGIITTDDRFRADIVTRPREYFLVAMKTDRNGEGETRIHVRGKTR